jgi:hypothetical protein
MIEENYGAAWTPEHEKTLDTMFKQGFSPDEIAHQLGRTRGAVLARLHSHRLIHWDNGVKQFFKIVWLGK